MTQFTYDPQTGRVALEDPITGLVYDSRIIDKGLTEQEFIHKLVVAVESGQLVEVGLN